MNANATILRRATLPVCGGLASPSFLGTDEQKPNRWEQWRT